MIRTVFLRRLRQQPVRAIAAIVAVAAGVALSSGVVIGQASIDRSLDGYTTAIAGVADLRVDGPIDQAGLPDAGVAALRAVPGVEVVAPTVVATTRIERPDGERRFVAVLGVDCAVVPICPPAGGLAVAPELLDEAGPGAILRTDVGALPLDAATPNAGLSSLAGGQMLVLPRPEAQAAFARADWYDTAFVTVADGASVDDVRAGLAAAAGPSAVVRPAAGPPFGKEILGQLLVGLLLVSLIGLITGAQLVANTLALSMEERRRELATVAAVGATPAMLARGVLLEAGLLGAVGGLLGSGFGVFVARPAIAALNDQFARGLGVTIDVHVPPIVVGIGVVAGVAVGLLAGIRPARRLARLDIAAELVDRDRLVGTAAGSRWLLVASVAGVVGGLGITWLGARDGSLQGWQPIAAQTGLLVTVGVGFQVPGEVARHLVGWLSRTVPVTGALRTALGSLAGDVRRTRVVAGAIAAPIALGVTLGGLDPALARGSSDQAALDLGNRVEVSALPANNANTLDAKLSPAEVATIAAVPGVAAVQGHHHALFDHPDLGMLSLIGVEGPLSANRVYRGAPADGPLAPGEAYVGPALARSEGLTAGDDLVVPGREGSVRLVVRGVWAEVDRLGRNITVDRATFARIAGPRPPSFVLLVPAAGVPAAELMDRVAAIADDVRPGLIVGDAPTLGDLLADEVGDFTAPFHAVQRGLLVVALVATASTLLLAGIQRRREHALLGAIGMTATGLAAATFLEVAVLGVVSAVVGGVVGAAGAVAFATASGVLTGLRLAAVWTVAPLAVAMVLAIVAALIGAVLPALRTARIDPATALRYE